MIGLGSDKKCALRRNFSYLMSSGHDSSYWSIFGTKLQAHHLPFMTARRLGVKFQPNSGSSEQKKRKYLSCWQYASRIWRFAVKNCEKLRRKNKVAWKRITNKFNHQKISYFRGKVLSNGFEVFFLLFSGSGHDPFRQGTHWLRMWLKISSRSKSKQ